MRRTESWIVAGLAIGMMGLSSTVASAASQAGSPGLDKVLSELDAAAARFQSAQADFAWDQYTSVVQSHDIQKGVIAFRRGSKATAMVAHIRTDNDQPSPKDVLFKDGQVDLYQPAIKQETILQTGPNQQQYESYSTLGFGSSGKDLAASWNVNYLGQEKIDGVDTAKLDLTSKHPTPNPMFTHITIWMDTAHSTSLRQQFFEPSGDYRTATYTNIRLNNSPDSMFEIKVPKGTNVVRK
jgi:outer membrane lipoprotein-sorting protein